ncbi:MAG: hypothetical protein AABZ06_13735 [Bdellovibrionota bacterium]
MLRQRFSIIILIGILWSASAAALPSLDKIPNGYTDGRIGAKYGTYSSTVGPTARPFQMRLIELENKAYGLSLLAKLDPAEQAELVFVLENEIIRLHRDIAELPKEAITDFDRHALLYGTVRTYENIRHHGERLFEDVIRFIDIQLPGPNGQQIRTELRDVLGSIYEPNYRCDEDLTQEERSERYNKRLDEFLKGGGSLGEIKVMDNRYLEELSGYMRVEYVEMESGEVRATTGSAGHILLAQGGKVKSAGQLILVKDSGGNFTFLIVSNASGSYKPDLLSARLLADKLTTRLGLRQEQVIVVKGEPVSSQTVKLYLKGRHEDPAATKRRISELEKYGKEILNRKPLSGECGKMFSALIPAGFCA